jgi:hypothetical protein
MKKWILGILVLLLIGEASANVYITEIMHSPEGIADSEGEYIEIYNDGSSSVNLNGWQLKNKTINNVTLNSKEYMIFARELIDGPDTDIESFEQFFGNNNGIWDEGYQGQQLSISLKAEDTIVLTNGVYYDIVTYNSSLGGVGGKSLQRISVDEWIEALPTPGNGSFSSARNNYVEINLNVENRILKIINVNMTDESIDEGFQVMPEYNADKLIEIEVFVEDSDGFSDVQNVVIENYGNLSFLRNETENIAVYKGTIAISNLEESGMKYWNILANDCCDFVNGTIEFEYLGMIATELNVSAFDESIGRGEAIEKNIGVLNKGNVIVDFEVYGEDLVSENGSIGKEYIEVYENGWNALNENVFLDKNLAPNNEAEILFRMSVPKDARVGKYQGKVVINAKESRG